MDDLTRWLASQGLEGYAASFAAQKVDLALLAELTEADLKELGVAALGDRKRLLKAIAVLAVGASLEATSVVAPETTNAATAPAEHRQLTLMFSDLVDSTVLAGRLDPEDWQELLRSYHNAVAAAVVPYGGHVAQFLGDGALIYFGYPRAHEDDADRAARAALEAVKAVADLNPRGIQLATRIGIATGQVVVGEVGIGKSRICLSLRDHAAATACTTVVWQCSPYFSGSALYPVVQHLMRAAAINPGDAPEAAAAKLDTALVQVGATLAATTGAGLLRAMGLGDGWSHRLGDASPPVDSARNAAPPQTKRQSLEAVLEMLLCLARARPVLLLIEDAHWIDPTTEELIGLLVDRIGDARVLMLITCRPEYVPTWGAPTHLTRLTLSRLGQRQCASLIDTVAGKPLPDRWLWRRNDAGGILAVTRACRLAGAPGCSYRGLS